MKDCLVLMKDFKLERHLPKSRPKLYPFLSSHGGSLHSVQLSFSAQRSTHKPRVVPVTVPSGFHKMCKKDEDIVEIKEFGCDFFQNLVQSSSNLSEVRGVILI